MYGFYFEGKRIDDMDIDWLGYLNGYVDKAKLDLETKGCTNSNEFWPIGHGSRTKKGKSLDLFGWKKTVSLESF